MGAGPLRGTLEQLRDELQLQDSVAFIGLQSNPFPILRRAELFVLPSRAEGLPYALLEAMACGCPAVAFACPDGPREIIRHNTDGRLVPNGDIAALAAALDELLRDDVTRRQLAAHAPEVLTRFGLDRTVSAWEEIFESLRNTQKTRK